MSITYIFRRFLIFLVVVWAAATFNFLLPRLGGAESYPREADLAIGAQRFGPGRSGRYDHGIRGQVRSRSAPVEAISDLYVRYGAFRLQLLDRQLPAQGFRHDRRGDSLDHRAAADNHDSGFSDRQFPRGVDGMAEHAEIPGLRHAADPDDDGDPLFLAGPHSRLYFWLLPRRISHVWRLHAGHYPLTFTSSFYPRRHLALYAAGPLDPPGGPGLLGDGHARHDGDDPGRRLRHLRRRHGPARSEPSSRATPSAMPCCPR